MPDPSTPLTWGLIGSLGTFSVLLAGIVARAWPIYRRVEQFLADWTGEPERPGFPARPGVPKRLEDVERGNASMAIRLDEIAEGQQSLAAAQTQKSAAIADLTERFDVLEQRIDKRRPLPPEQRSAS